MASVCASTIIFIITIITITALSAHVVVSQKNHCGEPAGHPDRRLDEKYLHTSEFKEGEKVAYKCGPGHVQTGGSRISFCEDGRWTALSLKCGRKKCSPLKDIENGKYIQGGQFFGDIATAVCNNRYVLRGDKIRQCGENGWNGTDPVCEISRECVLPELGKNGKVTDLKVSYKSEDRVNVSCPPGFSGSGVFTCRGRKWIPHPPKCRMIKCAVISISRGSISTRRVKYNTSVNISCDAGFRLHGASQLHCAANGSWTPEVPRCEAVPPVITCSAPVVSNGDIKYGEKMQYRPQDTVTISCRRGFDLIGSPQITCRDDGQWEALPKCHPEVKCSAPFMVDGRVKYGEKMQYRPQDTVTIVCREGFDLIGSPQITCGEDGQWEALPKCRFQGISDPSKCGPAPLYPLAHPREELYLQGEHAPGTRVRYKCSTGFSVSGGREGIYCTDGHWTELQLLCERKKCGSAGEIFHGRFEYTGVSFGDSATVICDEGYEVIGPALRYCRDNGWDGRNPECEPVYCPPPAAVRNADMFDLTYDEVPFGHVVSYRCRTGTLIGAREIHCTQNGTWSSPPPECTGVSCPAPRILHGSRMSRYRPFYSVGNTVMITCNPGFRLRENRHVTCGADGEWKPQLSSLCVRV